MDYRDGVLFTAELNRNRRWDGAGEVVRCFAAKFGKENISNPQAIQLVTPDPSATGPVPVVSCFQANRPGWQVLPALPPELGFDRGLLVSVEAGDILYFRANSIDNAQDDVVRFVPSIDYVRLAEDTLGSTASEATHTVIYGLGNQDPDPSSSAVISSLALASSACAALNIVDKSGVISSTSEEILNLCDPWGRSIVRYRGTEEKDLFVSGSGLLVAPVTGRMHFEGALVKPQSTLDGEVAIRILPKPTAPNKNDPSCSPDQEKLPNTVFRSILEFGRAAGSYPVKDPQNKDNSIFVTRGDKVCIFFRFRSLDTGAPIVWPQDTSSFKWKTSLSAEFDRKLLVVPLDRADRNPDDLLAAPDKALLPADPSECPAPPPSQVDVPVPPGNDPTKWPDPKTNPWPTKRLFIYSRCVSLSERHWVAPRSLGAATNYFFADYKPTSVGPVVPVMRFSRRLNTIKLQTSALDCPTDPGFPTNPNLREYRFRLDTGTLNQPASIPLDGDTRQPEALSARPAFAVKRMMLSLLNGADRQPLKVRAFTVRPSGSTTPITDSDLASPLGATKVDDQNPSQYVNSQYVRHLPANGPTPVPDPRDAFYVNIKEGSPINNPQDNGVHVYPADRVGYSFCAPDQAEIEIVEVIDKAPGSPNPQSASPLDTDADKLISTGVCGSICPLASETVRLAQRTTTTTVGQSVSIPIHVLQRLPIEAEFIVVGAFLALPANLLKPV